MNENLDSNHFPRIVTLAAGRARVTRCDATDIAFDRVEALGTTPETYRVTVPAQAVPPIAGFDPETAEEWPGDAALVAAIDEPPDNSVAQFVAAAKVAVQAMLDARAQQSGYDGILSAASYAGESTGAFAAEGAAFQTWRSAVWAACYAALGSHGEGDPLPTMASFLAELPAYIAP